MAIAVRQFGSVDGAKKNLNQSNITVAPFDRGSVVYTRGVYNAAHVSKKLSLMVPRPKKDTYIFISAQNPETAARKLATK